VLEIAIDATSAIEGLAAGAVEMLDAVGTVVMFDRQWILLGKAYLISQEIINLFCQGQHLG